MEKKKIYEENGQLILEAEYLNGKLNGKVKVYYEEKLTFEGEYLNNILNGKVKIYDENKLIFDVEYLNGKLWNGKGYNSDNNEISFEIFNGKGIGYIWIFNI